MAATPSTNPQAIPAAGVAAAEPAVAVRGLRKAFGATVALEHCSLAIGRGEFVSLLGPSGCGKTTLLRIIGGFVAQDEGSVELLGHSVDGLPPNKRAVNTVFQGYALFPHKTVFENISFPLELRRVPKEERRRRVAEALELVRLPDIGERSTAQLSGGQSQRVALARTLVSRPEVLLLDEPLAALDLKLRKAMQIELRRIQEELGTTFLYVTHDQEEALTMSDRIVLMNSGRIEQDGRPREIYEEPSSVFTSDFIGEANLLGGVLEAPGEVSIDGMRLAVRPSTLPVGSAVVVSVRPEAVRVGEEACREAGVSRFEGTVTRVIFLGPLIRLAVELPNRVSIAVAVPRYGAAAVEEGQPITLGIAAPYAVVLPSE